MLIASPPLGWPKRLYALEPAPRRGRHVRAYGSAIYHRRVGRCAPSLVPCLARRPFRNPRRLELGFAFRGARVPFLAPAKGIFRARAQEGEAALPINTSSKSPYNHHRRRTRLQATPASRQEGAVLSRRMPRPSQQASLSIARSLASNDGRPCLWARRRQSVTSDRNHRRSILERVSEAGRVGAGRVSSSPTVPRPAPAEGRELRGEPVSGCLREVNYVQGRVHPRHPLGDEATMATVRCRFRAEQRDRLSRAALDQLFHRANGGGTLKN